MFTIDEEASRERVRLEKLSLRQELRFVEPFQRREFQVKAFRTSLVITEKQWKSMKVYGRHTGWSAISKTFREKAFDASTSPFKTSISFNFVLIGSSHRDAHSELRIEGIDREVRSGERIKVDLPLCETPPRSIAASPDVFLGNSMKVKMFHTKLR